MRRVQVKSFIEMNLVPFADAGIAKSQCIG
jgi:hypothetical protein